MHLRFAEEIVLLALDDRSGKLRPLPDRALDLAVAGALLMELAFSNRLDADDRQLMVLDRSPTGDSLLDAVLSQLPEEPAMPLRQGISRVAMTSSSLRQQIFQGLVAKGILKEEEHRYFFVLKDRRYPVIDDREEKEVVRRIREVVIEGEIPDPRDVVIICLMQACDLGSAVFTREELEAHQNRIREVAKMDLIGQALSRAIAEIQKAILETISYMGI